MRRTARFVFSGTMVLATLQFAACKRVPTAEQMEDIKRLFETADSDRDEADSQFRTLAPAVSKRALPVGDRPCPVSWELQDVSRFADDFGYWLSRRELSAQTAFLQLPPASFQSVNVSIVERSTQLEGLGCASRASRASEERRLLERQGEYAQLSGEELVARARALIEQPLSPDLLIEIRNFDVPEPRDEKTFSGGLALGRAYLWSNADRRFVCGGNVMAESSSTVLVWRTRRKPADGGSSSDDSGDRPYLNLNLYMNLIEAAKKSLRAF